MPRQLQGCPRRCEKIFGHAAVDNLVHNPVEISPALLQPPRAVVAPVADASFLSSGGAAPKTGRRGLGGTRSLR